MLDWGGLCSIVEDRVSKCESAVAINITRYTSSSLELDYRFLTAFITGRCALGTYFICIVPYTIGSFVWRNHPSDQLARFDCKQVL